MTAAVVGESELATIIQTYNDVTERLKRSHEVLGREVCRLREELHEKNRELERRERLAALGEMAAGVAHEIRNPLGAIGLYASLLERDLADRPAQLEIARRIGVGVHNLESVVGDTLAFAAGSEPKRGVVRVTDVVESVLTQTAPQAQALEATIDVDEQLAPVRLFCDVGQLERLLLNLVFNALDAAGPRGRVWIRAGRDRPAEDLFPLVVADNGPGIDPTVAPRVFNPFFTTKHGGTGLGLAIVHRIVEAHGGSIVVGRRDGGGAAFTVRLPRARRNGRDDDTGGSE